MEYISCALIGYIIGMIAPAYFMGKFKGIDVRKKGLCDTSASNSLILFGRLGGISCALLDFAKGFLAILLISAVFPNSEYAIPVTAFFCIVGHAYPFYTDFVGGRGIACLNGIILAISWRFFLIVLVAEIFLAVISNRLYLVALSTPISLTAAYGIIKKDVIGAAILLALTAIVFLKYLPELRAIKSNTETRISSILKLSGTASTDQASEESTTLSDNK